MRRFLSYPLLLIIAVIFNRVIVTSPQISPAQSARSLVVSLILAGIASAYIYHRTRNWHRTDFMVASFVLLTLIYQAAYRELKFQSVINPDIAGLILIPFFTVFYFYINRKMWSWIPDPAPFTHYVNLVVAFLVMFQIVNFSLETLPLLKTETPPVTSAIAPSIKELHLDPAVRPDIYVIVLDGYGREDVLREIYNHDNSKFINELQNRGFYVAQESHSNYVQTPYVVASLMNFDHIQPWSPPSDYSEYLQEPIQNNRAFKLLKDIGYTTVSFNGTTGFIQMKQSDYYYSSFLPLNAFETFLLADTPLEPLTDAFDLGLSIPSYATHRMMILNKFNAVKKVPASVPGPKITYFHVLVPHPPFVFDEYGNPIEPDRPYTILDGNEFAGSQEEYRSGYRKQVIFANGKILEVVDTILKESRTPPVIVLMSDHGPGSMFNWDPDEPGCLWERTGNFYALYMPGQQHEALYPSMTPVNTFRVIFNAYFGTNLPLLDDSTYYITWQDPDKKIDITDRINSKQGCAVPDP